MVEALSNTVQTHAFLKKEEYRGHPRQQWFPTNHREQTVASMLLAIQRAEGTVFLESDRGVGTTACLDEWRRRYVQADGPVWFLDGRDPDTALKLDHALMKCMVAQPATSTGHPVIVIDHASSIRWELLSTWMRRVKGGMADEHREVRWIIVGDTELKQHLIQLFPTEPVVSLSFQPFTANESQRFLLQRGYDITLSKAQIVHEQSRGNAQRIFEVLKDMNCIAKIADHSRRDTPPVMLAGNFKTTVLRTVLILAVGASASALYFVSRNDVNPLDQELKPANLPVSVQPSVTLDIEAKASSDLTSGLDSLVAPMVPEAPSVQATPSEEAPLSTQPIGQSIEVLPHIVSAEATTEVSALPVEATATENENNTADIASQATLVSSAGAPDPLDIAPIRNEPVPIDWISSLEPSHYFVQLTTGRVAADVEKFVAELKPDLPSVRSVPFENAGKQRYAVVLGPFSRFADAQRALSDLPVSLRKNKPWIRTVKQLQSSPEL